jgi:hypothetical protein
VAQFNHIFEQNSYWQGEKYMAYYVKRMHMKEAEAEGHLDRLVEAIKVENAKVRLCVCFYWNYSNFYYFTDSVRLYLIRNEGTFTFYSIFCYSEFLAR